MPAITITDLENAKTDVDHLAAIANSTELTATDRLGRQKRTLAGLSEEFPNAAANAAAAAAAATQAANEATSAATAVDLAFAEATAAQASRVAAELARTGAESARDAAQLSAGVYANTAAGLAATTSGRYFSVPSADSAEYLILYQNSSGSAVEVNRYPSASIVSDIEIRSRDTLIRTAQLFDLSDTDNADGFFVNSSNGNLSASSDYIASHWIPVTAGLKYSMTHKSFIAWYNAGKTFISGSHNTDTNNVQTAPAGAAFLRVSILKSSASIATFMVSQSEEVIAWQPFGGRLNKSRLEKIQSADIENGAVNQEKTNFLKPGKNLLNKNTLTAGFYIDASGAIVASASYSYSDFIAVTPGQYVSSHTMRFTAFYDADKNVVAGGSNANTSAITVPAGVAYARVTITTSQKDTFQLEAGSAATAYEAFGWRVLGPNGETLIPANPGANSVGTAAIQSKAVTPAKVSFLDQGKNLFDKSTATSGFFWGPTSTNPTADAAYAYSVPIPVQEGQTYRGRGATFGMRFIRALSASGAVVGSAGSTITTDTYTVPVGVAFLVISVWVSNLDTFQFEAGSEITAYEKYGFTLGEQIIGGSSASSWSGKKWGSLGDSITAQSMWQPAAAAVLGMVHQHYGIGGTRVSGTSADAMWQDARVNAIAADRDLVTVLGGTNDWANNVALGTPDSTDTATFMGAYNVLVGKLMARFPTARVLIGTTPYGELPGRLTDGSGWTQTHVNSIGLTTRDYADACRTIARRWGLPVIDFSGECGWNISNIALYMKDDGGRLHPNEAGGARMAEVSIGRLRNLEPVT